MGLLARLVPGGPHTSAGLLAKILARTAEVTAGRPEPLNGQRIRPARPGGLPQPS